MSDASYRCVCGATLQFEQDLEVEPGTTSRRWTCGDCGTSVPGKIAEQISHQDPS